LLENIQNNININNDYSENISEDENDKKYLFFSKSK